MERKRQIVLVAFLAANVAAQTPGAPRAIVLDGPGPWRDARWVLGAAEFSSLLADAGYQVNTLSPADLATAAPSPDVLLAVPSLESLPLAGFKGIAAFASAGGTLMASGGEPFRDPLYPTADGKWLSKASLLQAVSPARTVLDPVTATLSAFVSGTGTVTRSTVSGSDGQSRALDFQLQMPLTGWYLLSAPLTRPIFPAGQSATIVWTRGTPGQSMMFEWDETDGSRWIATVPLTSQWTKQVLLSSQFFFWPGSPTPRAGTAFNPAQADKFFFGVAAGQGAKPGPLEFAVSAIGVGAPPSLEAFAAPLMENVSPSHKQYTVQTAGQMVRVPFVRPRGLSATPDPDGRFRAIGDLTSPSATWYVSTKGTLTIWLPWPRLQDPQRAELVALLSAAANRLYLLNAGPAQIVTLPNENIVVGARVINAARSPAQASLVWSIADSSGVVAAQSTSPLSLAPGELQTVPTTDMGQLPPGEYAVTASLVAGTAEADHIDSRLRVFDPPARFQPDQRIVTANGSFITSGGNSVYLQGVNYWPRSSAALETSRFRQSWLLPENYDPDLVEADLTLLASLNFNLVSIQYHDATGGFTSGGARSLVDFLDRCRNHGMWANVSIVPFPLGVPPPALYYGQGWPVNPNSAILQAAFLPGNDRVFAYDLQWEPQWGPRSGRLIFDNAWRRWIIDQYGTLADAEKIWGYAAPRDEQGQVSNPLDDQIQNDGPWRVMVAAYRRFVDDSLSRWFGILTRSIRAASPGTLLSYRNGGSAVLDAGYKLMPSGAAMLSQMNYDLGTAAAHLDFLAPHAYAIPIPWPDGRGLGFAAAYGRYRSGGKPVFWSEYGINIGSSGENLMAQSLICDSVMRLVNEDGSGGAAVWWMPGGSRIDEKSDYGILNPDGSPRPCAQALAQWGASFAARPPVPGPGTPVSLTVDRDADARGDIGLFLRWQRDYVQARQTGRPVNLRDAATGTDTSNMPLVQVGNVPYAGAGPLKYANGELAGIHVQCDDLDLVVENGARVPVTAGSTCQITPVLANTGSASWLPTAQSKSGVILRTDQGDLPLQNPLGFLQRGEVGPLQVTTGPGNLDITGRPMIQGVGSFGETLRLSLVIQ